MVVSSSACTAKDNPLMSKHCFFSVFPNHIYITGVIKRFQISSIFSFHLRKMLMDLKCSDSKHTSAIINSNKERQKSYMLLTKKSLIINSEE